MEPAQLQELIEAIEASRETAMLVACHLMWAMGVAVALLTWQIAVVGKDHLTLWGRRHD
jgi:cation transport ATPase